MQWSVLCKADENVLKQKAVGLGALSVEAKRPTLNEIFVSLVKDDKGGA
jgi:hypothetical protein